MQGGDTEILSESPGISHELFDELGNGERDRFCSEEPLAGTNEDEDQGKVKGIDGVAGDLHNGLVQLEEPGGEEADEGGGSHDWEDAEDDSGGDGPAEFFRGDALSELLGNGLDEPPPPPGASLLYRFGHEIGPKG